jgi:hypothetical protein
VPGVSARRIKVEARTAASKKVIQSNARRRKAWKGKEAVTGKVCGGLKKKPMAQWDWEVQDRGSRTKLGVIEEGNANRGDNIARNARDGAGESMAANSGARMERVSGFLALVNISFYNDLRAMRLAALVGEKSASSVGVGCVSGDRFFENWQGEGEGACLPDPNRGPHFVLTGPQRSVLSFQSAKRWVPHDRLWFVGVRARQA